MFLLEFCVFVSLTKQKKPAPLRVRAFNAGSPAPAFKVVFSETLGDFFGAGPEVIRHRPMLARAIWQSCHIFKVVTREVVKVNLFFHDLSIRDLAPKRKIFLMFFYQ